MLSSRRISAPDGRTYESAIPKKQTRLVTPRKTVKRNITYGKSSSGKRTTLTQIWDWEKIINDETVNDEKKLASLKQSTIDEEKAHRSNKRENDHVNSNDYIGIKKRSSRKIISNEIYTDANISPESKAKRKNIDKSSRKSTGDKSFADAPLHHQKLSQKPFNSETSIKLEVIDDREELLRNENIFVKDSASSSQITQPLDGEKSQPELSESFDSLPSTFKKKKDLYSVLLTPKPFLASEVPSSQSPSTPISLPSRGSVIFRRSSKKITNNNPIPFKLKENNINIREVMDTYALDCDLSFTDYDTPKVIYNNPNYEIQDTLDPDTYFNFSDPDHSSRAKLISPSKSVKFVLPDEVVDRQISLSPIVYKNSNSEAACNKTRFQSKNEILDSEAESDEEIIFCDEKNAKKNIISEKYYEETCHEKIDLELQNLLTPGISEQIETYYGETLDLETLLEQEKFLTPHHKSHSSGKKASSSVFSEVNEKKDEALSNETQNMETMRLSTQYLGQITPRTSESDIFMSIDPQRVIEILNRSRDHETRRYKLPPPVSRVWLYERHPVSAVKYMAEISPPKFPGDIINEGGIGNKEFNLRKSASSWCAYEILQMYELSDPLTLDDLKSKEWLKKAPIPMKWTKIPPAVADELVANIKKPIFEVSIRPDIEVTPSKNTYATSTSTETPSNTEKSIPSEALNKKGLGRLDNNDRVEIEQYSSQMKFGFKKEYPSSQATTVDLSPVNTPRQQSVEIVCETPTQFENISNSVNLPSPKSIELSRDVNRRNPIPFSMASSQLLTESQLLPDSLLNDCTLMPEPILPSSEDYVYN